MSSSPFRYGGGGEEKMPSPLANFGSTNGVLNGGTTQTTARSARSTILRNGMTQKKKTNGSTHTPASVKFMEATTFLSPDAASETKTTNGLKSVVGRFATPRPPTSSQSTPSGPSVTFGEATVFSPLSSEAGTTPATKSPLTPLSSNGNVLTPSAATPSNLTRNAGRTPAPASFNLSRDAGRTPGASLRIDVDQLSGTKTSTPPVLGERPPVSTPPSQNLADNDAWKNTFSASASSDGARSLFTDGEDAKENKTPLSPEDVEMMSPPNNPPCTGRRVSFASQHDYHAAFGLRQRRSYPAYPGVANGLQHKTPPPRASMSIGMSMMETPVVRDDTQHRFNNNDPTKPMTPFDSRINSTLSPSQRMPIISGGPSDSFSDDDEWSSWVLIHGFTTREECEFAVRRFQTYGTVLAKNREGQSGLHHSETSKWVALQYETPLQAQKALCQNQKFFDCAGSMLVIGVIPVTASLARTLGLGRMEPQPPSALFASPPPMSSPRPRQRTQILTGRTEDQKLLDPHSTHPEMRPSPEDLERRRRLAGDPLFRFYAWMGGQNKELHQLLEHQPSSGPPHLPGTPTYLTENDILLHPPPKRPVPRESAQELELRRQRATSICGRIMAWLFGWDEMYQEIYFDSLSE